LKKPIDWSQIWYPGPRRVFTPQEMALAGSRPISSTAWLVGGLNGALVLLLLVWMTPGDYRWLQLVIMGPLLALAAAGCADLWRHPTRRRLAAWTISISVLAGLAIALGLGDAPQAARRVMLSGLLFFGVLGGPLLWWFVAELRSQQIEARLREQAEQARALAMVGQLAAAQIQPHFLYNALGALQHWVQAKDDRAAPMLDALIGFLRATLPLFNRPRLALGDEAVAVREYLEVMRLRLGERLRYRIEVEPEAAAAQVPPGLLLTLAENAVEHGVTPSLHGAVVAVQVRREGPRVLIVVADTGPGLAPGAGDGIGLANTRTRLAQAFGGRATLQLDNAAGGGCIARISAPLETA